MPHSARRTRRAVPLSALLPLLAVVTALALAVGATGTGVAAGSLSPKAVKKIAAKVVKKKAKKLRVKDAANLAGQPASAYLTTASTIALAPVSNVTSFDQTLPVVAPGTYQASLNLTAALSRSGELFCTLFQDTSTIDLIDAYGAHYEAFRTVAATRVITVTGRLHLFCKTNGGAAITSIPANPAYAPAQLALVKVDAAASLGVGARQAVGSGATSDSGAPTR